MQLITSIRSTTIAFLGSWSLLACLIIALRVVRIQYRTLAFGVFGKLVYVSDIIFLLVVLLVGLLSLFFIRNKSRKIHRLFLCTFIPLSLIIAAVEMIATRFYTVSGATIDAGIIRYTLQNLKEVQEVVSVEAPVGFLLGLTAGILVLIATPLLLNSQWEKRFGTDEIRSSKIPYLSFAIISISILIFTAIKPDTFPAFGINATTLIASSALASHPEDDVSPPERPLFSTKAATLKGESKKNLVVLILESTRASGTSVHPPFLPTTPSSRN